MYSDRLFQKLAAGNVKRSVKDYYIYFFTLTCSVCLFYSFNSISTQFASLGLEDPLNYLMFSSGVIAGFSVLVCVIMGALVVYANRFLLRRRKKELGVYATLGMERRDLNRLLMKETLRVGVFSLVFGLALGIFAAQILSLVTARLVGISLSSYRFMVSGYAMALSVVFFGILFLFVHWFNVRELGRMSLIDLLNADRKNETVSEGNRYAPGLLAICSAGCLLGGYGYIIKTAGNDMARALGWGGLLLITGTFLFFTTALGVGVRLMKKDRNFYYRGLNLFTVNQLSSGLKTEGRSAAMISILLFLSLSLIIIGPGTGKYMVNGIENAAPFDGTIYYAPMADSGKALDDPMGHLGSRGFEIGRVSDAYEAFWTYESPAATARFLHGDKGADPGWDPLLPVMGIEDYNRLLAMQGIGPVSLGAGEFAVSYAFPPAKEALEAFGRNPKPLELKGKTLLLKPDGLWRHAWQNRNVLVDEGMFIVPQEVAKDLTKRMWYLNFNFSDGDGSRFWNDWMEAAPGAFGVSMRHEVLISIASDNLMMTYLGIYLGITFLIVSGAVLAIRQMAGTYDDGRRYGLLKKMGVSGRDMRHSLLKQLLLYFGCPLLVALLNAGVAVWAVFRHFQGLKPVTVLFVAGTGVLMVLAVYTLYFITTYLGSRRYLRI